MSKLRSYMYVLFKQRFQNNYDSDTGHFRKFDPRERYRSTPFVI